MHYIPVDQLTSMSIRITMYLMENWNMWFQHFWFFSETVKVQIKDLLTCSKTIERRDHPTISSPLKIHSGKSFLIWFIVLSDLFFECRRILRNIWCLFYFSHGQSCTWMLYLHEKLSYLIHRDGISWIGTRFIDTNSSNIFFLVYLDQSWTWMLHQLWSITK